LDKIFPLKETYNLKNNCTKYPQPLHVQILVSILHKIIHTLQLLIVRQNEVSTEAVAKGYGLELEEGALLFVESHFVTQE
jgi:hypothetical protein